MRKNKEITLSLKGFRPDGYTIGNIYKVGVPSIIMQAIGSVMTYGMNMILITFSATATAVFGVYFKLQSFFFMPVFGLNNGMIPIVAYNYGAGKRSRLIKAIKCSLVYAFVLLFAGFIVFETMPAALLGMFDASEEMLAIGVPALRIICVHFLLAWFCIISGAWKWCIQPCCVCRKTACGSASGSIYPREAWRAPCGLVGISDCRGNVALRICIFYDKD